MFTVSFSLELSVSFAALCRVALWVSVLLAR